LFIMDLRSFIWPANGLRQHLRLMLNCAKKHNVIPLEFNCREDSIFQTYNVEKKTFMEYLEFHGIYADIPVDVILAAREKAYGRDRVRKWIDDLEKV